MDPIQQILAQGQIAQAGEGLGQFYFEGRKTAQEDQRINLSKRRMLLDEQQQANDNVRAGDQHALAPFQQQALSLRNQVTGIDIYKGKAEAEASVETMKGDLAMSQMVTRRLADGTIGTPEAMTEANAIVQRTPYAAIGQTYQKFAQQFQIAQSSRKLADQFGVPQSATVIDKETGTQFNYGQKTNLTADVQDLQYLERLKQAVVAAPTPEARSAAQSALNDARIKLKVNPDVTDATKAVQTRLEEQNAAAANAFTTAKQLIPFLNRAGETGLGGLGNRMLENGKSLMGMPLPEGSATEAASINTRLKSELIGMARGDGNLARSEKQVEAIVSGMPDVTRWFHGASQAKVQLADAIGQIGDLSRANAKTLGKPISPEWLKPTELFDLYASGKITKAQLDSLQSQNGWSIVKQLKDSATAK